MTNQHQNDIATLNEQHTDTMRDLVRLAFWKAAFWAVRKRHGISSYHVTLAPGADNKTAKGKAELLRNLTHSFNNPGQGEPIDLDKIM